jgi:hypothetical protein
MSDPRWYLAAPVPAYRLISVDGEDLGSFRAPVPKWSEGDLIHRGAASDLVVVRLVSAEDGDDVDGYLVVRTAV